MNKLVLFLCAVLVVSSVLLTGAFLFEQPIMASSIEAAGEFSLQRADSVPVESARITGKVSQPKEELADTTPSNDVVLSTSVKHDSGRANTDSSGSAQVFSRRIIPLLDDREQILSVIGNSSVTVHSRWSSGISVTAPDSFFDNLVSRFNVVLEDDLPLHTMTYEGFDLIDLDKAIVDGRTALLDVGAGTTRYLNGTGNLNLTGKGQTIAVIDSGLVLHPEYGSKELDGWDFYYDSPITADNWNHGSRMGGIMFGSGIKVQGLAYEADYLDLRITDNSGGSWTSHLNDALQWCIDNATAYNITTVYIGVGTGLANGTETACVNGLTGVQINNLTSMNITVVAPSGVDSNYTHIAFPACVANSISVGAVPDGGGTTADQWDLGAGIESNRRPGLLDVLAPGGDGATKTTNNNLDYTDGTGIGTSVSAAYVAGSSMLLKEFWDARGWNFRPAGLVNNNIPNTIEYIFNKTGKPILDPNTNFSYPRIDIYKAFGYEEFLPDVTLNTGDKTLSYENVSFEYTPADASGILNCTLHVNGSVYTDDSVDNGTVNSFNITLPVGFHDWYVECYDNSSVPNRGVSSNFTIGVRPPGQQWLDEEAFELIRLPEAVQQAQSQGIDLTGEGYYLCSIDSGVDYEHGSFGSCTAAQVLAGNCPRFRPESYNFRTSSYDFDDDYGHGTASMGIAAGNSTFYKGMAPEADILAYKISNSAGGDFIIYLHAAIFQCLAETPDPYKTVIDIGVMTPQTANSAAMCEGFPYDSNADTAVTAGIFVVAGSGNAGTNGLQEPACSNSVTSVAAVKDGGFDATPADVIPSPPGDSLNPTRSATMLDFLAPGYRTYSPLLDDSYDEVYGTAYAASQVAGAALLLRQYYGDRYGTSLTPAQVKNIFAITGEPVYDPVRNTTFPRIDLFRAINYEEWVPLVFLNTSNNSVLGPNASLEYTPFDGEHDILNCTLFIDSVENQTVFNPTNNALNTFNVNLPLGSHTWQVECYDNATIPNLGTSAVHTVDIQTSPPNISGLPDLFLDEDATPPAQWVDLWSYTFDLDTSLVDLNFSIVNQSNTSLINCFITGDRYLECAQPALNEFGTTNITVSVSDNNVTDFDDLLITVNSVNDAPVALGFAIVTDEDRPINMTMNCSDVENDPLTYLIAVTPSHGTYNINGDVFEYTPAADYDGPDYFEYFCNDGSSNGNNASVNISVLGANDAPVLSGVPNVVTDEDVAPPAQWIDLHNYTVDPDTPLTSLNYSVVSETNTALIDCSIVSDRYVECSSPAPDQWGSSTVTVQVYEGNLTSSDSFVVSVQPVNDAPVAYGAAYAVDEDSQINITLNCSDIENDPLNYNAVSAPSHGSVLYSGSDLTYTPDPDYFGPDQFRFNCDDTVDYSNNAFINLTVNSVNDVPVLSAIPNVNVDEDTLPPSQWIDLRAYASDVQSPVANLTFSIVSQTNASLIDCSVVSNRYVECAQPALDAFGDNDVTVQVSDGSAADNHTFTVTVNSVNDAPIAHSIIAVTNEDHSVNISLNCSDVENDPLTYSVVSAPLHGSYNVFSDVVEYTPDPDFDGFDYLFYACDDGSLSSNASVNISVVGSNDPPVFSTVPNLSVDEDTLPPSQWIDLYNYTSDPDTSLSLLTFVLTESDPALIDCSIVSQRYFECAQPALDAFGESNITIEVVDGNLSDFVSFSVSVNSVNDAPVISNLPHSITVDEGQAVSYNISAFDVENDLLIFSLLDPEPGMSMNSSVFNWPSAAYGTYAVNISVDDNNGGVDSGVLSITVNTDRKPDLFLQHLSLQSTGPRTYSAVIRNVGNRTVDSFGYELTDGVTTTGTISYTLNPNALYIHTIHTNGTGSSAQLVLDPEDDIDEWNETNNVQSVII